MSFSFKPLLDSEVSDLLKPGIYDFEIKKAELTVSKKGNQMIRINLVVWDKKGREVYLYDYLLEAMKFKLVHFCSAIGFEEQYESGNFHVEDLVGRNGKCRIQIEEANGDFPAKNSVKDYLKSDKVSQMHQPEPSDVDFHDDPLPF